MDKRTIAGCLVAVPRNEASRMLAGRPGRSASQLEPVKCGVDCIWVSKDFRRQGIATALMDCLRLSFQYGSVLAKADVAFSSPSEDGTAFATRYFDTECFFVYLACD